MKYLLAFFALLQPLFADTSITYEGGEGLGSGKHIVFLASDHASRGDLPRSRSNPRQTPRLQMHRRVRS